MNSPAVLGIASGIVSALLMGAGMLRTVNLAESAAAVAMLCLAPLPVFIAALGGGLPSGFAALAAGGFLSGILLGMQAAPAFVIFCGAPAIFLSYLAASPSAPRGSAPAHSISWRPAALLAVWATAIAALMTAFFLISAGSRDYSEGVRIILTEPEFKALFTSLTGLSRKASPEHMEALARALLPAAAGMLAAASLLLNLWLGLHIVSAAGWLRRPMPDFCAMRYPLLLLAAGTAMLAAGFLPDMPGYAAAGAAGAFVAAYLILALVILRVLTAGWIWQTAFFVLLAAAAVMVPRAVLASLIAAGVLDTFADFRKLRRTPAVAFRPPND